MSRPRPFLIAMLVGVLVLESGISLSQSTRLSESPNSMVARLYRIVIARAPIGISTYGNHFLNVFAPYLSHRLVSQIKSDRLCERNWFSRHRNQLIKPPFAWLELGLFSGKDDLSGPSTFHIERQALQNHGSTYVYVRFTRGPPLEIVGSWDVAVRVVREGNYPVIDDVVYLKGQAVESETRLSEILMMGCQGPHWVGEK